MQQATDTVMMIRPARFRSNPETAASNAFQDTSALPDQRAQEAALREFEGAVKSLQTAGVDVCVMEDEPEPLRPDAIFPNNWITTHPDGTVVLYPMLAESRRTEVRPGLVDALRSQYGFAARRVLDLTAWVQQGKFLEGTGSMVLDHFARVAYACNSPRTDRAVLEAFCAELDYEPVMFDAVDAEGIPVYHTNVMMWIGTKLAGVCLEAIPDAGQRALLRERLAASGRDILELSQQQVLAYAGNMLELRTRDGASVMAMSASAHGALTAPQLEIIHGHATPVAADIASIEVCAGGSLRCMLAEVFLPRAAGA